MRGNNPPSGSHLSYLIFKFMTRSNNEANPDQLAYHVQMQIFFALNLIFNGVMWTLFTKALARGTSTTQVSIINTSSNFMITAILGFFIFTESLPPLWWLGAAMLVAGNVIIGRREEEDPDKSMVGRDGIEEAESGEGRYSSEEEGLLSGEAVELNDDLSNDDLVLERKRKEDEEDILQLELDDEVQRGR